MHALELGSGCGLVGRAVASITRDPQFKSQHWQKLIYQLGILVEKTKIKIKWSGMAQWFKKLKPSLQKFISGK